MERTTVALAITLALVASLALPAGAQEVLPFPPTPSGSTAGRTMQESLYRPLPAVNRLPKVVLLDGDTGLILAQNTRPTGPTGAADANFKHLTIAPDGTVILKDQTRPSGCTLATVVSGPLGRGGQCASRA